MADCGPTHPYRPVAEWVPASGGYVPPHSVEVSTDGDHLAFVARAKHEGNTVPGELVPARKSCNIGWDGEEHPYGRYEVLVALHGRYLDWSPCNGALPPGAVVGGCTAEGKPLYIGRGQIPREVSQKKKVMVGGKVCPTEGVLYIPYGGMEHRIETSYEVLVLTSVNFPVRK